MLHTQTAPGLDADLAERVDMMARLVRCAGRFTDALTWWAGVEPDREERTPDAVQKLGEDDALLMDLQPGTEVLSRDGYLVIHLGGTRFRAAVIKSLIYLPGLTAEQRALLGSQALSAGTVLRHALRSTHFVYRVGEDPADGLPALRSQATLLIGGRPVLLARETVHWDLITHRAPSRLPHYVQSLSRADASW